MFYTVFDIETTGLNPSYCDIIQFAYINLDENLNRVSSGCLHFYHPDMHWSSEAEAVHGISQESLMQYADEFEDNIRKMYVILSRSNCVGHNILSFDFPFCRQFLQRNGMPATEANRYIDTMRLYRPMFGKNIKLGKLANTLGYSDMLIDVTCNAWFNTPGHAHDARWDATATAMILAKAKAEGWLDNV